MIFIASFSQEQVSISLTVFILIIAAIKYIQSKKIGRWDIINIISSIAGTIFVIEAPGNQNRMSENPLFYATPVIERTLGNVNAIYKEVFGYKFINIMTMYFAAMAMFGIFIASLCTISSMAFIPTITIRCYVPFVILSFMVMADFISDFINILQDKKIRICIEAVILIALVPFSYKNYNIILEGYKTNAPYNIERRISSPPL